MRRFQISNLEILNFFAQRQQVSGALHVDGVRKAQFLVKPDRGRRVENDVDIFDQSLRIFFAEAQVLLGNVARNGNHAVRELWVFLL